MHGYTPDPDQPFPTSIPLPDDGDEDTDGAGAFDPALETLADAIANVRKDLIARRLVAFQEVGWNGDKVWTGATFSGGDLQDVWSSAGPFLDGDEFYFTVSGVAGLKPMTEGHLRLLCSQDPVWIASETTDNGGVSGLSVGGHTICGPFAYASINGSSPQTSLAPALPQCVPFVLSARYTMHDVATLSAGLALRMSGKAIGRGDQASPTILVDQGIAPLTDAAFTVRVEVWRVTP